MADRARMVGEFVKHNGPGTTTGDIVAQVEADGLQVTRQTVSEWIKEAARLRYIRPVKQGIWDPGEMGGPE
jgi:hypothetical protein